MMNVNTTQIKRSHTESQAVKKLITSLMGLGLIALSGFVQAAFNFDFGPECDRGGCGTAEMAISINGNTLTMNLHNTSPITLDNGKDVNTPGITGFGFNLADPTPGFVSWSLTAHDTDGNGPVEIGKNGVDGDWVMNTRGPGVSLDFLPTTDNGVAGALYNPDAVNGFAATPNYETQAQLIITFDSAPMLAIEDCGGGVGDCNTFVRMQNVGRDGGGSLKLDGTPGTATFDTNNVPNPSPLALMGLGGILLGAMSRRKRQQALA
jgi:hypothetical protein